MGKLILWNVFEYLLCVIEIYILYNYVGEDAKRRFKGKYYLDIIIIFCVAFFDYIVTSKNSLLPGWLSNILIIVVCTAMYYLIFEVHILMAVLQAVLFFTGVCMIDIAVIVFMNVVCHGIRLEELFQRTAIRVQAAILSKFILFVFSKVLSKQFRKTIKKIPKNLYAAIILLFVVSITGIGTASNEVITHALNDDNALIVAFISFSILICNMIIYWILQQLEVSLIRQKEIEMIECQNKIIIDSTLERDEVYKEIRKKNHDFNNHISCIDMLLQMGNIQKARAYIQNMSENYVNAAMDIDVGNEIANAVINQKAFSAKKNEIVFEVEGSVDTKVKISDMDLCALLSNSLDNAIEATLQIDDVTKRKIKLILYTEKKNNLTIEIINSVNKEVDTTKPLKTSKANKEYHGIGTINMKRIVEKYNGSIEWKSQNKQFSVKMIVKNL